MNGRTALGAGLVVLAVLAGALFLDRSQRLVPVYAAARDLPAGTSLREGDLVVVRARLPAPALRQYLRPSAGHQLVGAVLTAPVRRETLVPAGFVLASSRDADLVELPVQVDPGDMAQGLRPGDNVQVLAAYTEGARRGRAVVLLPTAEVVRVLQDPAGLTGAGQDRGVQLRMPSDRAPIVAAAIATARIFVLKAPGLAAEQPSAGPTPGGAGESPADPSQPQPSQPDVSEPQPSQPDPSEPEASPPGGGQPTPTSEYDLSRVWATVTQPAGRSVR
jgi:SAF domain